MQIISGYTADKHIKFRQRLRLYNLSRPAVKKWRTARHNQSFELDFVDQWVLANLNSKKLCAVDCAGWYFEQFNFDVQCLESDDIARIYNPQCNIEYDILVHRPTYINDAVTVLFKRPWFLKYCKFNDFVNFLDVWTRETLILEFDPIYIQHNHLKFKLLDLVRQQTALSITPLRQTLWIVNK